MSFITTSDGCNLYYEDWGTGDPVVFIHGWPLSGAMWEYQMEPLARTGARCISYDRRGFGKSDKPYSGYDYRTLGADLAAILDHLDLSNVTLVGFSMGGGEVAEYVTNHNSAGRVTKAILVSSIVPYMLKTEDNPDGVDRSVFDQMATDLRTDRPAFLTNFTEKFFGVGMLSSPVSNPMIAANCELAMHASPVATLECARSFSQTDFRAHASTFNIPTLIIHGDADKTVPMISTGQAAAKLIPGAQFKIYKGAPHGLFYTHRTELNADITQFVASRQTHLQAAQ